MYFRPHSIWVAALVFQSDPAEDIFEPGRAWTRPYAPEEALVALMFQPLSCSTIRLNALNCASFGISLCAIALAWEAEEEVAAWAGAAARTIPAVAAATAAVERAFFGEARVRAIRETNTENLFFGVRAVACRSMPGDAYCVGGGDMRWRRDPWGFVAPCDSSTET